MRFSRLFSFDGRVGRIEWSVTTLAAVLGTWGIGRSLPLLSPTPSDSSGPLPGSLGSIVLVVGVFLALLLLGIALGTTAKRWHDRDRSGLWTLLVLLPVFGWAWVAIWVGLLPGTPGPNRYGPPNGGSPMGDRP